MISPVPALVVSFALGCTALAGDSWPQFRGPTADGHSDAKGVPLTWSETEHVKWKTALPGQGWSSPVVSNGEVWLTTAKEEGKSLCALTVELATGKILRDVEIFANEVVPPKHARNSYASPTPVIDGDRVYFHFGAMGTACLDRATGKKIWERRDFPVDHQNGPGGSATLCGDKLTFTCDGIDTQYQVAVDKLTGKTAWRSERSAAPELEKLPADFRKAYGTPATFTIDGHPQVVATASNRLYALDPDTGKELWFVDYPRGFSNVPTPIGNGQVMVISTGFLKPELWAIKIGGAQGNASASHVLWKQMKGAPTQPSPIIVGDRVYTNNAGFVTCINMQNGAVVWQQRIANDFAASPIYVDGRLYFFPSDGPCVVIAPGDTFQSLAENKLEAGCMASPAVVGKSFIVRTKTALYRIED